VARVRGWVERRPDVLGSLLPDIARLGDAGQAELARLAGASAVPLELRLRALELGEGRASAEVRDDLRRLLDGAHADLRERAALGLLRIGSADDRRLVLERFLAGAFRETFAVVPAHEDVPFLEAAARAAEGESRLRLARLVGHLADPARVPLLLGLWRTADGELASDTRDILRRLDPTDVLPFVAARLDDGDTAILDVVGATRIIPRPLVDRYARAADGAPWERFFERMAAGGTLTAPGLADVLAAKLARAPHDRRAVRIFTRLDDWSDPARVGGLAAVIAPALAGSDRDELLQWIVESTTDLDIAQRVRVLAAVGSPTDRAVVLALADILLAEPLQRETLAAPLVAAIDRTLDHELDGEPERVRRILGYRVARARTDVERSAAVDALEAGLAHRSPRVRLHAFRLLRAHAERGRYLSATRRLLSDDDPTAVRSAIRALAYGRHLDAVGEIAELVFHASNTVRAAATDGLLFLGEEAIPPLTRLLARLRPDRRRALTEIVERLRRGDDADDDADDAPDPADSI
jgi:HEAT repeat protein